MARNTQVDVRRALALAAAFDFLRCCSTSCLLPFLTLYFRQLGLTPAMTGVVMGTRHLITLAWSPAASFISKRHDRRRATVCGSLLVSAAVALVLLLVPPADVHGRHAVCNMSAAAAAAAPTPSRVDILVTGETSTPSTPELAATAPPQINGSVSPNVTGAPPAPARSKRSKVRRRAEAEEERSFDFLGSLKVMDSQHQLFFLLLIAVAIWELAAAPLEWTADDGVHEYLDYADASDRYAGSGPWPLLGAACGAGAAGTLVSQLSCFLPGGTPRSAAHFYLYAGVAVLTLPAAAYLPLYLDRKRDRTGGLLKAVQLVRGSPAALLCGATALLVGAASSAVDNFLLWQMQDHGSGELHMGLTLALALLSHAAFSLLAARVSRVLSPGRLLAVGAASLGLQCLYYSFLWAPWAALPAQLLSCFSGGALWWAVRVQSEDVATPGAERSVRRIYGGLCLHLGLGLGGLGGGVVAQRFGVEWLLRAAALALMAWSGALPLLQWKAPLQRRINYSRLLAADASDASDSGSEQERDWLDKALQDDRSSNNNGNNNGNNNNNNSNSSNNGNSNNNNNNGNNRSSRGGAGRRLNL